MLEREADCEPCPDGTFCSRGSVNATPCALGSYAPGGSSECLACRSGTYQDKRGQAQCEPCPPGKFCPPGSISGGTTCRECTNETLALLPVRRGEWRLGPHTDDVRPCLVSGDATPCVGGTDAGVDGAGYCMPLHEGPLCEVCSSAGNASSANASATGSYFDEAAAQCVPCPQLESRLTAIGAACVFAILFVTVLIPRLRRSFDTLDQCTRRFINSLGALALLPKLKLIIGFCQNITPTTPL